MMMKVIQVETKEQLADAYDIRGIVFIKEQKVAPELEHDEFDQTAKHFVGYVNEKAVATSRLRFVDDYGKLERIAVLKEERGKSYGKEMIAAMEEATLANNYQKAKLSAQTHAEEFYIKLGYRTISDVYMDAGIPHVTMIKDLL